MPTFYVSRAIDPIRTVSGEVFRVRILTVCATPDQANQDANRRKANGETGLLVVTDECITLKEPRKARQVITAKVGTGKPRDPRFTSCG